MDTQILRRPEPGQIWQHRNGGYYHIIAIANEEHKHEDHPVDVVYRSMRQDNGQPSHWWTRPLATWHEKMTFVSEHNDAVPAVGMVHTVTWYPEDDGGIEVKIAYRKEELEERPYIVPSPGTFVRMYPAPRPQGFSSVPYDRLPALLPPGEVCAANHTGHRFVLGPNGWTQCEYCGEPK